MKRASAPTAGSAAPRLGRSALGERLSGFIYGTIVALSVVVAGVRAYPHGPGHVAALVAVTSVVFWIAHVYAHGLGHGVVSGEHLSLAELRRIARREGSIVEAAVPPVAALVLGGIGVLSPAASAWLAFALGLAVLAAQGLVFARIERLGVLSTALVVTANLGLGLLLVALKLVLSH
ncbi:MAG TPA: hypothetical protein VKB10_02260 [Gaiellaceae bacterium]|nr:hypothetical protein [Gaiellaceae bacterium]